MREYELLSGRELPGADFAVVLTDDSLRPYASRGDTVRLRRRVDLKDGDVGLFESRGGLVFRQYCRDSQGNIYLFSVDRRRKSADLVIPAGTPPPVCYGRAELGAVIPLPND